MPSTPGFVDALGERFLEFDLESGTGIERLHFRRDFSASPAFESALRDQIERFEYFRHPAIAIARAATRLPSGALVLESRHVAGRRLSEVGLTRNTGLALEVVRQLTPAIVALHEAGDVVHGLVSPDRVVVTRENKLVLMEHVLGCAMSAMRFPAARMREEFGAALPPSQEAITIDQADDLTELGLIVLSLLVGRRIQPDEYPDQIERLVGESATTAADLSPEAAWMRRWIERAVRVGPQPFRSAREAVENIVEMSDTGAFRRAALMAAAAPAASAAPAHPTTRPEPAPPATPAVRPEPMSRPEPVARTETPIRTERPAPPEPPVRPEPVARPEPPARPVVAVRPAAAPKPVPPPAPQAAPMWSEFVETTPIAVSTSAADAPAHSPHAPVRTSTPSTDSSARPVAGKVAMSHKSASPRWLVPGLAMLSLAEAAVIAGLVVMRPPTIATLQASSPAATAPSVSAVPPAPEPKAAEPAAPAPSPAEATTKSASAAPAPADATPAAEQFGGVKVTTPFDLQVFEGGKLLGVTAGPIALRAGPHALEFANDAYEFRSKASVLVKPGQLAPITVTAPLGKLSVNAVPWADVEIDGKAAGQTPLANLSVAVGQHEIVFHHPQLGELHQTAVVKATTPTRLSVTFPK
jgi:hypothetical protein